MAVSRQALRFGALAGLLAFLAAAAVFHARDERPDSWVGRIAGKALPAPTVLGWQAHVETRAGDGSAGFADGRPARFADPYGLAYGAGGIVYISDGGDTNRIRVLGADGIVSTLAGGAEGFADGQGERAAFHTPSGLALDRHGNLYVADTGNHAIRRITPTGLVSTVAGTGQPGWRDGPGAQAQFNGPVGVAVDSDGNVYVADTYNDRIRRIGADGLVSTLAGGAPGFADGPAALAQFDTPCAVLVDPHGGIFVADTRNGAIRKIGRDGGVTTVARDGLLRRPAALALAHDGVLYVGDFNGRIVQVGADHGLAELAAAGGQEARLRLRRPTGLALGKGGELYVAEAAQRVVRRLTRDAPAAAGAPLAQAAPPKTVSWPVRPGQGFHEIVGTMGEVRGNYEGEARHHFHGGLDVQGEMGAPVHAVAGGKVSDPLAAWGAGDLGEGVAVDAFNYIHMRVGRKADDTPLDPERFQVMVGGGKVDRVRVRRGTRFAAGDVLGTVNRMYHVHLEYVPDGAKANPLALSWPGYRDTVPPAIDGVALVDREGRALNERRGKALRVARAWGPLAVVVDAYDRMDGNAARRRLGLYKLGLQLLRADGQPVAGYEQPRFNVEFDSLPPDDALVKLAYAEQSGITVHGNARTRFLYSATNLVRGGAAQAGALDLGALAPGDYLLRVIARDHAGNEAQSGRDVALALE